MTAKRLTQGDVLAALASTWEQVQPIPLGAFLVAATDGDLATMDDATLIKCVRAWVKKVREVE